MSVSPNAHDLRIIASAWAPVESWMGVADYLVCSDEEKLDYEWCRVMVFRSDPDKSAAGRWKACFCRKDEEDAMRRKRIGEAVGDCVEHFIVAGDYP